MNLWVTGALVLVFAALWFMRINLMSWMVFWLVASWVYLRYGIEPPLPLSIVNLFVFIIISGLITYATSDEEKTREIKSSTVNLAVKGSLKIPRIIIIILLPLLVGWQVYRSSLLTTTPPVSTRVVHPAPPEKIDFKGEEIDLVVGDNPYRELEDSDPEAFQAHVNNGMRVYFENCVFCHGPDMRGKGLYHYGLDPTPTNFQKLTISELQESYLFWRIAKGAPGLPEESAPWSSSMPAWEPYLSQEEIWDVILYLYDYTGLRPRAVVVVE